jgi:predicted enzyme related to lactoylglutathione lyase
MEVMLAGCFVEDLETAKKFYMEKLGLSVMFESQGFCEVSDARGGMVIGLSQSPRPSGQEGAVVCFKVADLPREQERLLKSGVKLMETFSRNRASCVWRTFVTRSRIASNWSSICAHDEIVR